MKKILLITISIVLSQSFFSNIYSQVPGYIIIEGEYKQGQLIERFDKKNMQSCIFKKNKMAVEETFTPDQISEFGYLNQDKVFIAHDIYINDEIKKVFLRKFSFTDATVLFYSDKVDYYFKVENDSLIQISKSDFKSLKTQQNKEDFGNFLNNSKIYLILGPDFGNLETNYEDDIHNSVPESIKSSNLNFYGGLGMDIPIGKKWYITTGLGIGKSKYEFDGKINESSTKSYYLQSHFTSINIPASIKYEIPLKDFSFLLNFGGNASYRIFSDNFLRQSLTGITILIDDELMHSFTLALSYGFGIRYKKVFIDFLQNRYAENDLIYNENQIRLGLIINKHNIK